MKWRAFRSKVVQRKSCAMHLYSALFMPFVAPVSKAIIVTIALTSDKSINYNTLPHLIPIDVILVHFSAFARPRVHQMTCANQINSGFLRIALTKFPHKWTRLVKSYPIFFLGIEELSPFCEFPRIPLDPPPPYTGPPLLDSLKHK